MHAAKTSPFTAAPKDHVRESHARDFISKPVHPKILDEVFPEFQQLLNDMEEEVPPITLLCLSPLVPSQPGSLPSTSGQKRRSALDPADLENTGASGSGGPPAKLAVTAAIESGNLAGAQRTAEEMEEPPSRDEALTAFTGSPHIPEPEHLKIDHISLLMAVLSPDNSLAQKQAIKLMSLAYDSAAADQIWQA